MTFSEDQVERIVREVVRRLLALESSAGNRPALAEGNALTLDERVISMETLRGRLEGVRRVAVTRRAVVTPAARDLLRERGVDLERQVDV